MLPKLNFLSCLAALGLFFLPWLNFQCSNGTTSGVMATQSGIEAIYGGCSPGKGAEDLEKFSHQFGSPAAVTQDSAPLMDRRVGVSIYVCVALIVVAGAVTSAFLAFRNGSSMAFSGVLCAAALSLLLVQQKLGFPAEKDIERKEAEKNPPATPGNPLSGLRITTPGNPQITAEFTHGWYAELVALGIPVAILANLLLDRMKKTA